MEFNASKIDDKDLELYKKMGIYSDERKDVKPEYFSSDSYEQNIERYRYSLIELLSYIVEIEVFEKMFNYIGKYVEETFNSSANKENESEFEFYQYFNDVKRAKEICAESNIEHYELLMAYRASLTKMIKNIKDINCLKIMYGLAEKHVNMNEVATPVVHK